MDKIKLGIALLLVPNLAIYSASPAVAGEYTVVPGHSVGRIRLGATRATVLSILGQPSKSAKWRSGPTQDTWLGPVPPNNKYGFADSPQTFVNVIYRNNRVVQIEFNSPKFRTSSGISTRSNLAQFRSRFGKPRVRAYGYEFPDGGSAIIYYYDAARTGITFSVGVQDNFDATTKPNELRVHSPGVPVLPDPGGRPAEPKDEVPVGSLGYGR